MEKFIKNCPICNNEMLYKSKKTYTRSIKYNCKCKKCGHIQGAKNREKYKELYIELINKNRKNTKGKSHEEIYGLERSKKLKKLQSEKMIGDKNPSKNQAVKNKISNTLKARFKWDIDLKKQIANSVAKFYDENPDKVQKFKPLCFYQHPENYTKPELKIKEFLEEQQINFTHNIKIGKYWPDFTIEKCVIEVDGVFWHSKTETSDKKKDEYLIDKGYSVLRITDEQIFNEYEECKKIILNFLHTHQKLINNAKC